MDTLRLRDFEREDSTGSHDEHDHDHGPCLRAKLAGHRLSHPELRMAWDYIYWAEGARAANDRRCIGERTVQLAELRSESGRSDGGARPRGRNEGSIYNNERHAPTKGRGPGMAARRVDRIRLRKARAVIRRLKPEFVRSSLADFRYLERIGLWVRLRKAAGGDEPRTSEFLALLDKKNPRLVVTSEFTAPRAELASRVACGVFGTLGLYSRTIRTEGVREVVTSYDPELLSLWFRNGLSATDYPYGKHPVVSALFMGRPLRSVLSYYTRVGPSLPQTLVSRETALYASLIKQWRRSVELAKRSSVVPL